MAEAKSDYGAHGSTGCTRTVAHLLLPYHDGCGSTYTGLWEA